MSPQNQSVAKLEFYWVASEGETPDRIFFDRAKAVANKSRYLDAFDAAGGKVEAYMLVDDEYTTNF